MIQDAADLLLGKLKSLNPHGLRKNQKNFNLMSDMRKGLAAARREHYRNGAHHKTNHKGNSFADLFWEFLHSSISKHHSSTFRIMSYSSPKSRYSEFQRMGLTRI